MIQTRPVDYRDGDTVLKGWMAWDDELPGARPGVLVAHAWSGQTDFERGKATRLAELGYVGFALDNYGDGKNGSTREENAALLQPFLDDRGALQRRMKLALDCLLEQPEVNQAAAIGFCFGGLSVLDLARSGASLAGVVSFHGLLGAPDNTEGTPITTPILVLHGWDDPMATPDQVVALAEELSGAGADWQLVGYGGTVHAFANPNANDPEYGTVYSKAADRRSWQAMENFLRDIFA
ncbi:MAG: dienelactone hydrolase family protein [Xanthomonadales bacterium]|nr:dienelactone hydrolase family protein [Xanthomonadales bacterium]